MSMIDKRRKPITVSSSDQVPPSSGPRCRMSFSDPSTAAVTALASPLPDRNPISPHTSTSIPPPPVSERSERTNVIGLGRRCERSEQRRERAQRANKCDRGLADGSSEARNDVSTEDLENYETDME